MKKCLILLFLIVLFIGIVITKTIIAEPEKESYLVNSVSVPFGFYNDPLPEYVASYTTLPFKDCFYFGPCSINWTGHFAVYGPAWFFAGKKQQGIYWYPFHDWGLSYDTVLKLNTQEMKNKLITNPENFAQWRFRESRHKYWDEYGFVIDNVYFPQWTQDGPLKLANSTPGAESRHSSNGEYFNVWDMPSIRELIFWEDGADVVIQFANFEMKFYEQFVGEYVNLKLQFHTKVFAKWDWTCDLGITGEAQSGVNFITIPNWTSPPSGL